MKICIFQTYFSNKDNLLNTREISLKFSIHMLHNKSDDPIFYLIKVKHAVKMNKVLPIFYHKVKLDLI